MRHADENRTGELARNVAVALRFKKSQGTPEMPQVEKEVLAPGYDRARGGNLHLAANARDTDFTHPGLYLRKALPDRVDVIERVIADGDRVGLLFRVTATHTGGFFGVPPSGNRIDVYEVAFLRLANGQLVEGWFMMAEGDEVWMRLSTGGTHAGALCGIAPTGKRVGVNVAMILRFADGKVAESWAFADEFGLLLQLGAPNLLST